MAGAQRLLVAGKHGEEEVEIVFENDRGGVVEINLPDNANVSVA